MMQGNILFYVIGGVIAVDNMNLLVNEKEIVSLI